MTTPVNQTFYWNSGSNPSEPQILAACAAAGPDFWCRRFELASASRAVLRRKLGVHAPRIQSGAVLAMLRVRIVGFSRMPVQANVDGSIGNARTPKVLLLRDRFQVRRVAAEFVAAEMVELQSSRYRPDELQVRDGVGLQCPSAVVHPRVALASLAERLGPDPAGAKIRSVCGNGAFVGLRQKPKNGVFPSGHKHYDRSLVGVAQ